MIDNISQNSSEQRHGLSGAIEDFLQSSLYTAVQRPIDGVAQLVNAKGPQLIDAPATKDWETAAGSIFGSVVDFALLSRVLGGTASKAASAMTESTVLRAGITSSMIGASYAMLSPVDGPGNFWANKARLLGTNAATFAVMGAVAQPLSNKLGDSFLGKVGAGAGGGIAGGITNVAATDLLAWKKPELGQAADVASWAAFGAMFGAVDYAGGAIKNALAKSPEPTESTLGSGNSDRVLPADARKSGRTTDGEENEAQATKPLAAEGKRAALTADDYIPKSPDRFVIRLKAEQVSQSTTVALDSGWKEPANAGDYILTDAAGSKYVMPAEQFAKTIIEIPGSPGEYTLKPDVANPEIYPTITQQGLVPNAKDHYIFLHQPVDLPGSEVLHFTSKGPLSVVENAMLHPESSGYKVAPEPYFPTLQPPFPMPGGEYTMPMPDPDGGLIANRGPSLMVMPDGTETLVRTQYADRLTDGWSTARKGEVRGGLGKYDPPAEVTAQVIKKPMIFQEQPNDLMAQPGRPGDYLVTSGQSGRQIVIPSYPFEKMFQPKSLGDAIALEGEKAGAAASLKMYQSRQWFNPEQWAAEIIAAGQKRIAEMKLDQQLADIHDWQEIAAMM